MVGKVDDDFIYIVDLDGQKTVTNDAESVVSEISDLYPNRRIFCRDTEGDIAELVHLGGVFAAFGFDVATWPEEVKARL